eukprot:5524714-Prymnesium_polylepis.1
MGTAGRRHRCRQAPLVGLWVVHFHRLERLKACVPAHHVELAVESGARAACAPLFHGRLHVVRPTPLALRFVVDEEGAHGVMAAPDHVESIVESGGSKVAAHHRGEGWRRHGGRGLPCTIGHIVDLHRQALRVLVPPFARLTAHHMQPPRQHSGRRATPSCAH